MAKRLRQSNLFDTFSKKHKESDSEEMSQDIMEESDTQTVTTIIVILRQKAPRIQDTITILNLKSYNDLQTDDCLSSCCTGLKPYQPTSKAILSSMANNRRNFVEHWYKKYPWLTNCTTRKKVFCFYCRCVEGQGMMTFSSKAESTFTKIGYNNWKKALEKFENYNHCNAHGEAVLKWQMLRTTPISNHLNSQIKKNQEERHC